MDEVDDDLVANVDELDVSIALFRFVDRLIYLFVIRYPFSKVSGRFFGILALIIRRRRLYLEDIAHDQLLIVAFGFNEDHINAGASNPFVHPLASLPRRIGRVENGDSIVLVSLEPTQ